MFQSRPFTLAHLGLDVDEQAWALLRLGIYGDFMIKPGDIVLGDRRYGSIKGMEYVREQEILYLDTVQRNITNMTKTEVKSTFLSSLRV